ncbi:FMN-binding protein [Fervidobacterium sp. SC_NGM5_O18]|jgi:Na+-transporting NADH:ubiquinone oxidoreductase subunit C|uniref:FMN-binding protein n=1 Tax=Fervidobacterium pennivorans TaxID=93466 RepID=A0A172T299_FERPE|nr:MULTISPECIES: FMN-binding protein [Fervidobacterium]ANE40983.1 FMN-binding protein [Fervidobacterium pennivorans]NPU88804.1 FMN-binding protein [Fervidobacterium sp.]PHJ12819.1 FMN-binding protein [Fervidobacterium sp. SC_NGM5_O18]
MRFDRDSKVYTVIFTFIVSFAFLVVLSGLNVMTSQQVKKNQELFMIRAVLNAMGIPYTSDDEAIDIFKSKVTMETKDSYNLFSAEVDGEKVYAILFNGSGLWGNISGVLAVNSDVSRIVGIDFISQSETPGLGGRIEESWFKEQFRNEAIVNGKVLVSTTKVPDSKDDGQVDAITGATLTSKSIEKIIATYIPILKSLLGVN